ncbi:SusC/RagA family TonB-linked outer membrane protein [Flavivirga sp. 57AJ16]|uniref:SusC/RagA family TonB-linked outer membrane protein n=1 Tax=Flavivirga sp. 57AJ16 TaxID=3025307 RepID=UPI002365667D|nr:SusC/RagA family TonB-linked outer membrane protein [Flavivirga sp. 57AJ16]MDD7884558.1 SusC/RagA family TonB-linked outer membrane protein [Flavivirga sp. 57AJ16]
MFSFSPNTAISQNSKIKVEVDKVLTVDEVFDLIMDQTEYNFIYELDLFKDFPLVKVKKGVISTNKLLERSLAYKDLNIIVTENNTIVIKKKETATQQQIEVTGKILDPSGVPMAGVSIIIKGTYKGTYTNFDGKYTILVPSSKNSLVFSFLGFKTKEVLVDNKTVIDITLKEEFNKLDELLLIAYGKTSKRLATSNFSTITSEEIEKQPVTNVLEALAGKVPGLFISQSNGLTGSKSNVSIRGQVSIASGQEPLYVIDGVPFNSTPINTLSGSYNSYGSAAGLIDPLNSINPADIESITVLKDAGATAIYGSRGANGVILIKTKRAKGTGTRLSVNTYTGLGKIANTVPTLKLSDYLDIRKEAIANDGLIPNQNNAPDLVSWDQTKSTDFQKMFLENTAKKTEVSASFTGGNDKFNYIFSNTLHNESTVFPGDLGYKRFSSHLGFENTSDDDKFKIGVTLFYTKEDNNQSPVDLTSSVFTLPPNYPLYNQDGSLYWLTNSNLTNPLSFLMQKSIFKSNNLLANATLSYKLSPGLTATANIGYNKINQTSNVQIPLASVAPGTADSSTSLFTSNYVETYNIEPQLDYVKNFKNSELSVLLGGSFQASDYVQPYNVRATGYTVDNLLGNLGAASEITSYDNGFREYNFASMFGRVNYTIKNRYLFTLTARRDGSTRFGENKRWGNFGSVAAGWIFSNEDWFKNSLPWFSYGKLRSSYGTVGNDQIPDYGYLDSYGSWFYLYDGAVLVPQRVANPDYSWETTRKFEVSLETGFLNDRLFLTTTWFSNRTDNQLISTPLPSQTGFTSYQANLPALVESNGLEVSLTSTNIKNTNFSWNTAFNLTVPRNRLVSFPGLENTVYRGVFIEGESIRNLTGYNFTGLVNGIATVEDWNEDGNITPGLKETLNGDYKILGRSTPDFYGGLNNTVTYKGLSLDVFFQFVKQEKYGIRQNSTAPGTLTNHADNILNDGFYYSQNTSGAAVGAYTNYYLRSNATLSDASFIRLKNVSLSYQLPTSFLKSKTFKKFGVSLKGQNLLTITNYNGFDPETGALALPPLRMITLGLNCSI